MIRTRYELQTGTRLPNYHEATIAPAKLKDYALNPEHKDGRDKAIVFASALGIYRYDWLYLHDQILDKLPHSDATRCEPDSNWGTRWEVPILVEGRNACHRYVVTAWITPRHDKPRLTSTYVEMSQRNRELQAAEAHREARDAA